MTVIRLLRWPIEQIGAFIDNLFPAAADLRARVQMAREEQQAREADELFEFFDQGADHGGALSRGGERRLPPTAPAPGHPYGVPPSKRYRLDRFVQADNKFQK